ncbi:unnamed protein product [Prunus armeniaca]|uniref:Wound-responsive family protein n=1 Tax=Prunus armeniaca TaxID=36596 RepID=A0A6J5WT24_PRUAR|nr:unnamed protein product [Prunus armeniaca]
MSSSSSAAARRGWVVAASVGVVEALKDQGICRWNYTMRLMQQHAKSQLGSFSQANKLSSSSSALVSSKLRDEKVLGDFCCSWMYLVVTGMVAMWCCRPSFSL